MKKRILTGIKPTGSAHIGNYFGCIKPAIEKSNSEDFDSFYFIADNHALNTVTNKIEMKQNTYNIAATWLACGLDPNNILFYRQTDLPELFHLCWILCNVTPKGLMNRAHAYKAMVEKNQEEGNDADSGVNMGLYNYPILMAADILLFDTNYVPVGQDQKQHVEIARDIAVYFNNTYGNFFVLPEPLIEKEVGTIVGLDGRKMSKSYNNYIEMFCSENELKKGINKIVTDSRLPGEPKDEDCNLAKIYKLFANEKQYSDFVKKLKNGLGWGDAKKELFEIANAYITPMREKFNYYMSHTSEIDKILQSGGQKVKKIAEAKLEKIKKAIGLN